MVRAVANLNLDSLAPSEAKDKLSSTGGRVSGGACQDLSDLEVSSKVLVIENTNLSNANLSGFSLTNPTTDFAKNDLSNADLKNSDFSQKHLAANTYVEADFSGATLVGTIFDSADPQSVHATRSSEQFTRGSMIGIVFNGADLSEAIIAGYDARLSSWQDTKCDGLRFSSVDLRGVDLSTVLHKTIEGGSFIEANLEATKLDGLTMNSSLLVRCDLSKTDLTETTFKDCRFIGCTLTPMQLEQLSSPNSQNRIASYPTFSEFTTLGEQMIAHQVVEGLPADDSGRWRTDGHEMIHFLFADPETHYSPKAETMVAHFQIGMRQSYQRYNPDIVLRRVTADETNGENKHREHLSDSNVQRLFVYRCAQCMSQFGFIPNGNHDNNMRVHRLPAFDYKAPPSATILAVMNGTFQLNQAIEHQTLPASSAAQTQQQSNRPIIEQERIARLTYRRSHSLFMDAASQSLHPGGSPVFEGEDVFPPTYKENLRRGIEELQKMQTTYPELCQLAKQTTADQLTALRSEYPDYFSKHSLGAVLEEYLK
jgi:uncharacterized protein YjbI with pentapeptide repeats